MRTLIYSHAKSGSTALAYHLKASLPDHELIFEPASLSTTPPDQNLIVKSFWKETDATEEVLSSFDKRILLQRHPLDRLLSVVIYKMGSTTRVVSDPFARAVIEAFEAIEAGKIGFRQLYETMWRLFDQPDVEISRIAGMNRLWLERGPEFFLPFRYEEMIAGRYDELAAYLGTPVVEGALPPAHRHVAHSKSEGGWKRWMTAEDADYFAAMPEIAEYAQLFSYDLTLPADATLDRWPPEGSHYVRTQIDRVRRRWGAPPFSTGSANGRPNGHFLAAANALDQGDFDRAFDASLNTLLSGSPEVLNYLVAARGFSQQGRPAASEAAARRATELAPWLVQGWSLLAQALQQLGRWDEAVAAADEVIRGEPDAAENHMLRATLLTDARQWAQAEVSLRRALACPNYPKRLHKSLASVLWELGRADEGLAELEIAIRHDPTVWHYYALKVRLCVDLGRLEEAEAALALASANPAALATTITTITTLTDRLRRARGTSFGGNEPNMSALERLRIEVERSRDAGVAPCFWWRDDDMVGNSANFDILMRLSERFRAPVLMAIIPALANPHLDIGATDPQLAYFCQHGWKHVNHEPVGEPKSEFGAARDPAEVIQELAAGAEVMDGMLGARRLPVMVAPWNAFHPVHADALATAGFTGLSTYGRRVRGFAAEGVRLANAHLDVMRWDLPGGARPMGLDDLLDQLATLVSARRAEAGPDLEPIGLLTHHRPMRPETWPTVEALFAAVADLPGMSWMSPPEVFA